MRSRLHAIITAALLAAPLVSFGVEPAFGTRHNDGLFLYREPVEAFWNDWVAHPPPPRLQGQDQVQLRIVGEGRTKSFDGMLTLNCSSEALGWIGARNFGELIRSSGVTKAMVPQEVIAGARRLFCASSRNTPIPGAARRAGILPVSR